MTGLNSTSVNTHIAHCCHAKPDRVPTGSQIECPRRLGSGSSASRWTHPQTTVRPLQAGYVGPDLALHRPVATFETLLDARAWLTDERRRIDGVEWTAPAARSRTKPATLAAYVEPWLAERQLKPRTRDLYRRLLDQKILPSLGDLPLRSITALTVREWYANLDPERPTGERMPTPY